MTLPDFVGIGAQRAATTWAYACLREHPEVFMPEEKELHFFNSHFDKGVSWYSGRFQPRAGQKRVGEITPNYLDSAVAIHRMARVIPEALLFVILRDPVQRALSAYHFFGRYFDGMSFGEACRRMGPLIELGLYAKHLKPVFACYPKARVKVFLYEDIQDEPATVLADLYRFIGVSDTFVPPSARLIYNSAYFPMRDNPVASRLSSLVPSLQKTFVGRWLRRLLSRKRPSRRIGVDPEDRLYLMTAFRDDILELQDMIGRDLTAWLGSNSAASSGGYLCIPPARE
jgi:hypothetical protein